MTAQCTIINPKSQIGTLEILRRTNQISDHLTEIPNPLPLSRSPSNEYEADLSEGFEATLREYIIRNYIRPVRQEAMSEASIAPNDGFLSSSFVTGSGRVEFSAYDQDLSDLLQSQTDLITQISRAVRHENVFDLLDRTNHQKIAERLRYLHEITQDDDPEDPAMKFLSLKELALFFAGDGNSLPYPQIGISPNGSLQAEWRSKKGSAVMMFLTDGNTRFAGTMSKQDGRQTIQGSGTKKHALQSILPFINDCSNYSCPT